MSNNPTLRPAEPQAATLEDWTKRTNSPAVAAVAEIEQKICRRAVRDILAAGYSVTLWNGGDSPEIKHSTDATAILNLMAEADIDELLLYRDGQRVAWVQFVYGNEGWSVIADHSDNQEVREVLRGAEQVAEEYEQ